MNVEPELIQTGIRGGIAVSGATFATMTPNEIASITAAVLTCVYVLTQLVTLLPKLLDSIKDLKRRWSGKENVCPSDPE